MAISACGGSRVAHDAVVAAANGNPLAAAPAQQHALQQSQQDQLGAVSSLPQNGSAPLTGAASATGGGTAIAWAAGQLLAKAVASHLGAQPTSQDILDGLWTVHSETLGGLTPPVTFVKGQPAPPISCYFLIELKNGRWSAPSGDTYAC